MSGVGIFESEPVNENVGNVAHRDVGCDLPFGIEQNHFGDFVGYFDRHVGNLYIRPAFLRQLRARIDVVV